MDTNGTHLNTVVAHRVGAAMTTRGYTPKKLSESAHIARSTLIRRLSGTSPFNLNELAAIATELDYPLSHFLATEGDAA